MWALVAIVAALALGKKKPPADTVPKSPPAPMADEPSPPGFSDVLPDLTPEVVLCTLKGEVRTESMTRVLGELRLSAVILGWESSGKDTSFFLRPDGSLSNDEFATRLLASPDVGAASTVTNTR